MIETKITQEDILNTIEFKEEQASEGSESAKYFLNFIRQFVIAELMMEVSDNETSSLYIKEMEKELKKASTRELGMAHNGLKTVHERRDSAMAVYDVAVVRNAKNVVNRNFQNSPRLKIIELIKESRK